MSRHFTLSDPLALDDLRTFVSRAQRLEDGSVRLIAGSGVLAVYAAVLYPVGLLDEVPTVLGLRTYAIAVDEPFVDAVVPIRSFLQRIETARAERDANHDPETIGVRVSLPLEVNTVTWAAISPPRGGWYGIDGIAAGSLESAAKAGIAEIAEALPDGAGEQIVRRVRAEVWSRPVDGLEHVPAGAAFAALSMGFLGDDEVRMFETGPWTRMTTQRGHVLVKRRAWTLSR
ncbi:hypothetical protein [Homoserinibacter sp. YIM 151385]|uniref:hypothetical protein n=1 Tax=Homoserinibacter sp. YIM 151385 TaxID=2985506 RepID=UPI0022F06DF0|nr:hypothetical protein [Homoserinibacter sp. YIM 151385]WBU39042.1 hypothetical protein OF852_05540 [Homoserinibacter sp. YIM 151385]